MKLQIIPLDEIQPNPFQPREQFEENALQELASSLKDASLIQPIIVRRHDRRYQIIAGERRWRAAQIAGLKEIPCIIRDISEERVLIESLVENLHRKDLTDIERENAIHDLWENRETLGFKNEVDLASAIGVTSQKVKEDLEAWEFRHKEENIHPSTPTYLISRTKGLPVKERKIVIDKVQKGELQAQEAYTTIKVLKEAPKVIKEELLKPKSQISPKMAESILSRIPAEEDQRVVVKEIRRHRLTEDEVEDRVREIQLARERGEPIGKEMGVQEGISYIVGEYDCPHCRKHYQIKCDGKRDWVE